MKRIVLLFLMVGGCLRATAQQTDSLLWGIQGTEYLIGLQFTEAERDSLKPAVGDMKNRFAALRGVSVQNEVAPALWFSPQPANFVLETQQKPITWGLNREVQLPKNKEELAFYSVADLSVLLREQKITSLELTEIYLNRLKRYGAQLECVISITEETALAQAQRADEEIAAGNYRGPLHGIPYGVKDLLAVAGTKTTWGAMPYKDQRLETTATVVKKLEEAGAVLIAKLTLGALAWGDVWYGGVTKNPWNVSQGASGSSAGSASATVAGLVGFSIGTETLGSIVSPSTRCGASGLRPSFGRVSRAGAMALSWSMDKIGPICRTIEDCALVFEVIRGSDGIDQTVVDAPFNYNADQDLKTLKVGYFKNLFESNYGNRSRDSLSLAQIRALGVTLEPIELTTELPVGALRDILTVEAAAAFDELTRSNRDSLLVRQVRNAWPNVFREARFVTAVEYIQANRIRSLLIEEMHQLLSEYDVIVTPSFAGPQLLITNLTGHPCAVLPNGFTEEGSPTSLSFIGNLYQEASILRLADAYQKAAGFYKQHPPLFFPK